MPELPRRRVLLLLPALAAVPALLAGCRKKSGPEKIRYDRDTCEICNMIISDPRFAAEIRDPEGRIHKFDDIGDAIHWMIRQDWYKGGRRPKEFWVMDYRNGREWLDAFTARYVSGLTTPMDYGFGAVAEDVPGAVDYETMKKEVIARGLSSRCEDHELGPGPAGTGAEAERKGE
ncbi:MAG TPA: hypothetical protein ENJ62_00580 [Bryobacterales bacterium]|nr:hypothetical protein [Bryobacterales bacterium]